MIFMIQVWRLFIIFSLNEKKKQIICLFCTCCFALPLTIIVPLFHIVWFTKLTPEIKWAESLFALFFLEKKKKNRHYGSTLCYIAALWRLFCSFTIFN
jgi:hypothetical protein